MSQTGFTKGPWQARNMVHAERGDQMTPEEIGEYVANSVRKTRENGGFDHFLFVTTMEDGPDICHVGNGPRGPQNAHLIASAPDLYEALDYVVDNTFCGADGEWHFKPGYNPQAALSALASARGEKG